MTYGDLREVLEELSDKIDNDEAVVCCKGDDALYALSGLTLNYTEEGVKEVTLYCE